MAIKAIKKPVKKFELDNWYQGESAKRNFGRICQAVNEEGAKIGILGSKSAPHLYLVDIDEIDEIKDRAEAVTITIEEAKADWSSVTHAAMLYGTKFIIHGKKIERAFLYRNDKSPHPALKYRQAQSDQTAKIIRKLEETLNEIKKLGRIRTFEKDELGSLLAGFERVNEVMERRFKDLWRLSQGYPTGGVISGAAH